MNDGLNKHVIAQEEQLQKHSTLVKTLKTNHNKELEHFRSQISILKSVTLPKNSCLNDEKQTLAKELSRITSLVNKKDEESRKLLLEKLKVIEELILLKKSNQAEASLHEDFLNKNSDLDLNIIHDEVKGLKLMEEEREKLLKQEREALSSVLTKIKNSVKSLQMTNEGEVQSLSQELALLNHKLSILQNDKDLLMKQRDEALLRVSRTKTLDKNSKTDLSKLVEFMKTQEQVRNKLFGLEKMNTRK
jgi:hypothetical protein